MRSTASPTKNRFLFHLCACSSSLLIVLAHRQRKSDMDVGSSSCNIEQDIERRRVWTSSETEALLDALDDAIARGGQCDNGIFRPGVLKQVEQMLAAKLPGCGLKANPHIESKMRKLKKDYAIVFDMLKTSGFGWNDSQKCVQVDSDTVWNSYIQQHPSARGWRNKPFPYYERLSRIFGRDRATGAAAETPAEMEAHESASRESFEELGDEIPPPSFNEPPGTGTSNHSTSSSRKRKREDPLAVGLDKMSSSLEKMVAMMTNQRAHEYASIQDSVGELDDILADMGYGTYDRVRLLNLFVEQPAKMALFRGLKSDEARQQYVLTLLSMM